MFYQVDQHPLHHQHQLPLYFYHYIVLNVNNLFSLRLIQQVFHIFAQIVLH